MEPLYSCSSTRSQPFVQRGRPAPSDHVGSVSSRLIARRVRTAHSGVLRSHYRVRCLSYPLLLPVSRLQIRLYHWHACVCMCGKKGWYHPCCKASTGGLGMHPPWMRGAYHVYLSNKDLWQLSVGFKDWTKEQILSFNQFNQQTAHSEKGEYHSKWSKMNKCQQY